MKTYRSPNPKIEAILQEITEKFQEAARIADEEETYFSWDGPGLDLYGGGFSYDSGREENHHVFDEVGKWRTSTMSCM